MYKLLVLDMDGTLLNGRQKISLENQRAIQKAVDHGIKVVLASGRPFDGMVNYVKELNLLSDDNQTICCCGAMTIQNGSRDVLNSCTINYDDLITFHQLCEKMELDTNVYTKNSIMVHTENVFSRYDAFLNNTLLEHVDYNEIDNEIEVFKINLIYEDEATVQVLRELFPTVNMDIDKVRGRRRYTKSMFEKLQDFPKDITDKYTIVKSLPNVMEVVNKSCNKAVAVEKLAQGYGINQDEIVCIGDSGNDQHMIEYAGLGIAMGNAFEEVKAIADAVTLTNNEHGVAYAIHKYVL